MSSSGRLYTLVGGYIRRRGLSTMMTRNNLRNLELLRGGGSAYSLVVLSIVVPSVGKFRMLRGVQRGGGIPILVLATGDSRRSGISNLQLKTSSCLAGPFKVGRLVTHIGSLVQHCAALGPIAKGRTTAVLLGSVMVSGVGQAMAIRGLPMSLANGRFSLLLFLTSGGNQIFAGGRLCARI